ncbi:hypothetical protein FACS1894199_01400 [Bacteroidia bacterium]|nr:hypothetical protein FACS1894199_01400 [Bacteroidia bacterium]
MMEHIDEKQEKRLPFAVPEGYFEGLENKIQEKIIQHQAPRKKRIMSLISPYLGLAAAFVLLFSLIQVMLPLFVDTNNVWQEKTMETADVQVSEEDAVKLDLTFDPSSEEIYEYLAVEMKDFYQLYAGL